MATEKTSAKPDGGPAFPTEPNTQPGRYTHHGMTLRDWFAGQALSGLNAHPELHSYTEVQVAQWAYDQADAMIAARAK